MLTPRGGSRIYLALRPVDMRKGFDGLTAQVQQVLQEDPDDARALVGLGQALAAGGDPEAALHWLMRSLSLQHVQPHTHHLLGRCLASR